MGKNNFNFKTNFDYLTNFKSFKLCGEFVFPHLFITHKFVQNFSHTISIFYLYFFYFVSRLFIAEKRDENSFVVYKKLIKEKKLETSFWKIDGIDTYFSESDAIASILDRLEFH